jgi:hypothetical protein
MRQPVECGGSTPLFLISSLRSAWGRAIGRSRVHLSSPRSAAGCRVSDAPRPSSPFLVAKLPLPSSPRVRRPPPIRGKSKRELAGASSRSRSFATRSNPPFLLVPTLRVGTHHRPLPRPPFHCRFPLAFRSRPRYDPPRRAARGGLPGVPPSRSAVSEQDSPRVEGASMPLIPQSHRTRHPLLRFGFREDTHVSDCSQNRR